MAVFGIHEAGGAKHPEHGIDGPVVLADERELVDRAEHHGGRALVNRVIGQEERERDAVRRRGILAIPLARVIKADNADATVLRGITAHAGGISAARAGAQLVIRFKRFLVALASAPRRAVGLSVALRRVQQARVRGVGRERDRGHTAKSLGGAIWRVSGTDPEADLEGRACWSVSRRRG